MPGRRKKNIDWREVRQKVEEAAVATEAAINPSPDRLWRLLEDRTRKVAGELERFASGVTVPVLSFSLRGIRYGVQARYVTEIIKVPPVTPIPRSAAHVVGVIDLRGQLLPVFDLARLLDLPSAIGGFHPRIVICGNPTAEMGFVADEVYGVDELIPAQLRSALAEGVDSEWLRGLDKEGRRLIDGAALLKDRRLFIT